MNSPLAPPPLTRLCSLGDGAKAAFQKLNIRTAWDLLLHLPSRYFDYRKSATIQEALSSDQPVRMRGRLLLSAYLPKRTEGYCRFAFLNQHNETLQLFFFHTKQFPFHFLANKTFDVYGDVTQYNGKNHFQQPKWQWKPDLSDPKHLTPLYHTVKGLTQTQLRSHIQRAWVWLKEAIQNGQFPTCDADFPEPGLLRALTLLHAMTTDPVADRNAFNAKTSAAHKRLYLEEWTLYYWAALQSFCEHKRLPPVFSGKPVDLDALLAPIHDASATKKSCDDDLEGILRRFLDQLPFSLTKSQVQAIQEILIHLSNKKSPMFAILPGEVGSGKTVVAACAALYTLLHHKQTLLLVPSVLLAQQHFETFSSWLGPLGYTPLLWTSATKNKNKQTSLSSAPLVIGTHAVLKHREDFADLGLLIIDEQHRFGVAQRSQLLASRGQTMPHQLLMSATPIPRTLEMSKNHWIQLLPLLEKPLTRPAVQVTLLADRKISLLLARLREKLNQQTDLQLYWVCARVEACPAKNGIPSPMDVIQRAQLIAQAIPKANVAVLHGQLKAAQQMEIMQQFQSKALNILVCTTVIEVGIDIPGAQLIIIEDADRLGLAQLHQLRGRIGRSDQKALTHCLLIFKTPLSRIAKERLRTLRQVVEGLEIAQADARMRGSGQWLGKAQAGFTGHLQMGHPERDQDLLRLAQERAEKFCQMGDDSHATIQILMARWPQFNLQYRMT